MAISGQFEILTTGAIKLLARLRFADRFRREQVSFRRNEPEQVAWEMKRDNLPAPVRQHLETTDRSSYNLPNMSGRIVVSMNLCVRFIYRRLPYWLDKFTKRGVPRIRFKAVQHDSNSCQS
jgi:hypothetical protein